MWCSNRPRRRAIPRRRAGDRGKLRKLAGRKTDLDPHPPPLSPAAGWLLPIPLISPTYSYLNFLAVQWRTVEARNDAMLRRVSSLQAFRRPTRRTDRLRKILTV